MQESKDDSAGPVKKYRQLWQAIIRPVRKFYNPEELGPAWFTVKQPNVEGTTAVEVGVKRSDIVLRSA